MSVTFRSVGPNGLELGAFKTGGTIKFALMGTPHWSTFIPFEVAWSLITSDRLTAETVPGKSFENPGGPGLR
jgi:hypothetical protein